jgi:hypothetical protein
MDFIEKFLGLSPDGGTGVTEGLFLLVPVVAIALAALRRYRRKT